VFTPEYKLRMVAEYDRASAPGERGGLLRREGLYHSHIIEWCKARDAGTLTTRVTADQPDARQTKETEKRSASQRRRRGKTTAEQAEVERLRRQNEKLARDLARTQAALEIMGKAHAQARRPGAVHALLAGPARASRAGAAASTAAAGQRAQRCRTRPGAGVAA
jgi:transposase-like protein